MGQRELPLMQRIEGPAVVPAALLALAKTYRQAVRACWALRRVKWTPATLSAHYGFTRQHVGDWINHDDKPRRRNLPGDCLELFEEAMGNTFISQWRARRAVLTVAEEAIADRAGLFAPSHRVRILAALRQHGPRTAHELEPLTGLSVVQIDRRMHELVKLGSARAAKLNGVELKRGTPTGGTAQVWEAA